MDGTHRAPDAMHVELQIAMNFIISYLYNKLPRTRVHLYGEELEKLLRVKFMGHWYPGNPAKGSAFRCVHLNSTEIDPSFEIAALRSGLDFVDDIKSNLPPELSVWVDPGEVSYVIGGTDGKIGPVKVLFKDQSSPSQAKIAHHDSHVVHQTIDITRDFIQLYGSNTTFNPHAKGFLPNSVDVESPEAATHDDQSSKLCYSLRPQRKLFTVNEFASTKFGSTKVKSDTRSASSISGLSPVHFPQLQIQPDILLSPPQYFEQLSQATSPEHCENPPYIQFLGSPSLSPSSSTTRQSSANLTAKVLHDQANLQANTAKQDPNSTCRWSHFMSHHTFEGRSWGRECFEHSLLSNDIDVNNILSEDSLQ